MMLRNQTFHIEQLFHFRKRLDCGGLVECREGWEELSRITLVSQLSLRLSFVANAVCRNAK